MRKNAVRLDDGRLAITDLWAVVAWAGDDGLLIDGDADTRAMVADWGAGDHWPEHPRDPGVWRWRGDIVYTYDGEDFTFRRSSWEKIWLHDGGERCGAGAG